MNGEGTGKRKAVRMEPALEEAYGELPLSELERLAAMHYRWAKQLYMCCDIRRARAQPQRPDARLKWMPVHKLTQS